jgi:hypothetical protein
LFALGAVIAAGGFAAAEVGATCSHAGEAAGAPSKLDYMVLASFVNSPHILSMASYRSTAHHGMIMSDGKFVPGRKVGAGLPADGLPGPGQPGVGVARP